MRHSKFIIIFFIAIAVIAMGFFAFKKFRSPRNPENDPQKITLTQAAQMGEKATQKLLVQIETPKAEGRYERGDIVLTAPADKEFSDAEKTGFLIIQMELTPKQAEILTLAKKNENGQKDENGQPATATEKRRKFAVDLAKIGIAPDDFQGKEILDKIFTWDALYQK